MGKYKHGHSKRNQISPTYASWKHILERCDNESCKSYKDYGGRGILYDPRWKDFINFLKEMGVKPKDTTIERVNNNGNYTRDNCIWANHFVQANNKRSNLKLDYAGLSKSSFEWADYLGITIGAFYSRYYKHLKEPYWYTYENIFRQGRYPKRQHPSIKNYKT
jgi:hypothetical protein